MKSSKIRPLSTPRERGPDLTPTPPSVRPPEVGADITPIIVTFQRPSVSGSPNYLDLLLLEHTRSLMSHTEYVLFQSLEMVEWLTL